MSKVKTLLLFLSLSTLLALVIVVPSAQCDEEVTETAVNPPVENYIPNTIRENNTPLSERSYGIAFGGRRVQSELSVDDLLEQSVSENIYLVGKILADLEAATEAVREQMQTRPEAVNPFVVTDTRKNCLAAIKKLEECYANITGNILNENPEYVKAKGDLETMRAELVGLRLEHYGTFAPLTIKIGFNPVEQREEAVYLDGNPVRFRMVMIPGPSGGSIVSLQKDAKAGVFAPMACNNIAGYPLSADGSRTITLTVGRERYSGPEEALKGLCNSYGVQPDKALGLIREGTQYVVAAK